MKLPLSNFPTFTTLLNKVRPSLVCTTQQKLENKVPYCKAKC